MKLGRPYLYIGVLFVAAFLAQYFFELKWLWLEEMQKDGFYKVYSGIVLTAYVLGQWALSILRAFGKLKQAKTMYKIHNLAGILAPFFFYAHSITFGYAYLKLLGIFFFSTVIIGLFNQQFLEIRNKMFSFFWMILHVIPSVMLVILMGYHIYIVLNYQ